MTGTVPSGPGQDDHYGTWDTPPRWDAVCVPAWDMGHTESPRCRPATSTNASEMHSDPERERERHENGVMDITGMDIHPTKRK